MLRADVRKARVCVLLKMINEVKRLKKRTHGDEKKIQKSKKKAGKLVKQIQSLKKLSNDDIAKYAVTSTGSIDEVLANLKSGPRAQVISKLANHKALKDKLQALRTGYPDYQNYVTFQKKSKTKSTTKKEETNNEKANDNVILDNKIIDNSISEDDDDDHAESDENSDDNSDEDTLELSPELLHGESDEKPTQVKNTNERKAVKRGVKHELQDATLPAVKKLQTIKAASKRVTVNTLNLDDDKIENKDEVKKTVDNLIFKEDTVHVDREVDSFFITSGNNDYLQVVAPKNKLCNDDKGNNSSRNNNNNQNSNWNNDRRSNQNFGRFNTNDDIGFNNRQRNNKNNSMEVSQFKDQNKFPINRQKNIPMKNKLKSEQTNKATTNEEVHPSWAARKKQQDILKQGFQGQKIVFDD